MDEGGGDGEGVDTQSMERLTEVLKRRICWEGLWEGEAREGRGVCAGGEDWDEMTDGDEEDVAGIY